MIRLVTAALTAALLLPASASAFLFQERGGLNGATNGVVLGPDGNLWATELPDKVVRMTPAGVAIDRFTVGANPTSMVVGPGGRVWVAVTGADRLVWIDALSATPTTHDVSTGATDCGPVGIVSGGDGRMYFTTPKDDCADSSGVGFVADTGMGGTNVVLGKPKAYDLESSSGKLFLAAFDDGAIYRLGTGPGFPIESDTNTMGGNPDGITVDGAGNIWFTAFSSGKVGFIPAGQSNGSATLLTPSGGVLGNAFGIVAGTDGKIYVTGSSSKNLARIDPGTNAFTFFSLGSGTPWQIVNGPDGDLWFTDTANPRLMRFVNSAPRATTGAATATSATTANLAAKVDPRGNATTVVFDYGTTTAYGSSTPAQTVPTGADPVDVAAALTGLAPSTTYHVRVRATNGEGETAGADATFTTPAAPVVVTPPVLKALTANAIFGWRVSRAYTRLTKFRIDKLAGGETATVACRGGKKKGCPFASKTYRNLKSGTRNLLSVFRKRKLRPGVVITVTVTKPGALGRRTTLTVRKRKAPKVVRRVLSQ